MSSPQPPSGDDPDMPVEPTGGRHVPLRARSPRLPFRVVAPLVVSAFLAIAIAGVGASGAERSAPSSIPDSAFGSVELLAAPSAPAGLAGPAATPDLSVVHDPWVASPPPQRAQPALPGTKPVSVPVATPKPPKVTGNASSSGTASSSSSHRISGFASYYCRAGSSPCTTGYPDGSGFNAYAAAGPRLRAALGSNWRGRIVDVDGIRVKLIDWCQCYKGESNEKLLDLYYDVFARTGSPVTIRW
jgi:hypothetical protein